jgi:RNA polymerase sigma factor (sigma-70 family)
LLAAIPATARTTNPFDITFYEGLVRSTAAIYAPRVETEFDDICQRLRIKVWRALQVFDPGKSGMTVERYVFMCMKNECKDIVKKVRRGDVYIADQSAAWFGSEDLGLDSFERRYLATEHEQVYGGVDDGLPLIPSTLTPTERRVIVMLYRDQSQAEIARTLGLRRNQMERLMRSIREKMADWKPDVTAAPLPVAVAA